MNDWLLGNLRPAPAHYQNRFPEQYKVNTSSYDIVYSKYATQRGPATQLKVRYSTGPRNTTESTLLNRAPQHNGAPHNTHLGTSEYATEHPASPI